MYTCRIGEYFNGLPCNHIKGKLANYIPPPPQVNTGGNELGQLSFPAEGESTEKQEPNGRKKPAEAPFSARDAFVARLNELKLKYKHVPQRYRGYEALLDVGDDPGDKIPRGVQDGSFVQAHACTL